MKLIAPSGITLPVTTRKGTAVTPGLDGTCSVTDSQDILDLHALGFVPDDRDILQPPFSLHFNSPFSSGNAVLFPFCL